MFVISMKTILWAALTANGNYAQSSPEHPPKPETLNDFAAHAMAAGNFVVGRRTFEAFRAQAGGGGGGPFASLDIVVVSSATTDIPGVRRVRSSEDALAYLEAKGHRTALLAGGAELHNTFLAAGLVDEIVFDVVPVLEGKGLHLVIDRDHYRYKDVQLVESRPLGNGVIQSRFAIPRS
jgi:dihydrofolate reductase